jgi:hypothetical protein
MMILSNDIEIIWISDVTENIYDELIYEYIEDS